MNGKKKTEKNAFDKQIRQKQMRWVNEIKIPFKLICFSTWSVDEHVFCDFKSFIQSCSASSNLSHFTANNIWNFILIPLKCWEEHIYKLITWWRNAALQRLRCIHYIWFIDLGESYFQLLVLNFAATRLEFRLSNLYR